jgi:hypothetical protein
MREIVDVRVDAAARAMFAVTNRADEWDEPSIPAFLREHYWRLAEAALTAVDAL